MHQFIYDAILHVDPVGGLIYYGKKQSEMKEDRMELMDVEVTCIYAVHQNLMYECTKNAVTLRYKAQMRKNYRLESYAREIGNDLEEETHQSFLSV